MRVSGVGGQGGRFKGKPRGFRCWGVGLRAKPGRRVVNNRAGGELVCSWCECKCAVSQLPVQTATCIFTGRMAKQTRFLYTPRRYKAPDRTGARILKIAYPPRTRVANKYVLISAPVGQRAVPVRKSDFGLIFSWMKIQRNNLLFLIFTGKKTSFLVLLKKK